MHRTPTINWRSWHGVLSNLDAFSLRDDTPPLLGVATSLMLVTFPPRHSSPKRENISGILAPSSIEQDFVKMFAIFGCRAWELPWWHRSRITSLLRLYLRNLHRPGNFDLIILHLSSLFHEQGTNSCYYMKESHAFSKLLNSVCLCFCASRRNDVERVQVR